MKEEENRDPNIYIVAELGWEYDDNNYYQNSDSRFSGEGEAFSFKKLAEVRMRDLNLERVKQIIKSPYEDLLNFTDCDDQSIGEKTQKSLGIDIDNRCCDKVVMAKLSDEELSEMLGLLGVTFYEIVQMKLRA